jgi:hypothetical protein
MIGGRLPAFGLLDAFSLRWERLPIRESWFRSAQITSWLPAPSGSEPGSRNRSGAGDIARNGRLALFASKRAWSRWDFQGWMIYSKPFAAESPLFPSENALIRSGLDYELRVTGHY